MYALVFTDTLLHAADIQAFVCIKLATFKPIIAPKDAPIAVPIVKQFGSIRDIKSSIFAMIVPHVANSIFTVAIRISNSEPILDPMVAKAEAPTDDAMV